MNNRNKTTIIGYIGTTLALVENENREAVWSAALKLSKINFAELDSFLSTLSFEVTEELKPIIDVIRNPDLIVNGEDTETVRDYIFECLDINTRAMIANPPRLFTGNSVSEISQQIQAQHAQARISPATGHNRSYNIDSFEETEHQSLTWLRSEQAQEYFFGLYNMPRNIETQQAFQLGVERASITKILLMNALIPHQDKFYNLLEPWLPENNLIRNSSWWLTAGITFFARVTQFVVNLQSAGLLQASINLVADAFTTETEPRRAMNRNASRNNQGSIWTSFWRSNSQSPSASPINTASDNSFDYDFIMNVARQSRSG